MPDSNDLADATLWDYAVEVYHNGAELAFDVLWNEEQPASYACTLQDAGGVAEMRISASWGITPLVLLGDTSLEHVDGGYRYRNDDGKLLTVDEASEIFEQTILFEELKTIAIQSARITFRGDREVSAELFVPFIEQGEDIEVGEPRGTFATQLTTLFHTLVGHSPFASQPLALEARYAYDLGGLTVEAPVLAVPRQNLAIGFDEQLVEFAASALEQWLDAVQPPSTEARLVFTVTLWTAVRRTDAPLLRLRRLALPMSYVTREFEGTA